LIGLLYTEMDDIKRKTRMASGFHSIPLDWDGQRIGGAGGNRTRVRKSSTDSSTYLALLFNLTCNTPTDKQFARELP